MLREESSDSVTTISIDRSEVLARLHEIVARVKRDCPEVVEVLLIGSLARNTQTGSSDVDLLVLLSGKAVDRIDWTRRLLGFFDLPLAVDLIVMGQREFEDEVEAGNPLFCRMRSEGRLL